MRKEVSKWYVIEDATLSVRRRVRVGDKSRLERYPVSKYREYRHDREALERFVVRLNATTESLAHRRAEDRVTLEHAFINDHLLAEFALHLRIMIPNQKKATAYINALKRYFLDFYINKLKMPNPVDWHRNQSLWSQALQNRFDETTMWRAKEIRLLPPRAVLAASTLRTIVNTSNRFMGWLHARRPLEVPPLKFEPLSDAVLKSIDAQRDMAGKKKRKWFIKDDDWALILRNAPETIRAPITLAYWFGLRRAETLGFDVAHVKKGYQSVERQLKFLPSPEKPVFSPLKGKTKRKVPFWLCPGGPAKAHSTIKKVDEHRISADYLSHEWADLMEKLKMPYGLHDIRRTWITRCFRVPGILPTDIQLAAGHVNITTTMLYKLDDRDLDEETFVPKDS